MDPGSSGVIKIGACRVSRFGATINTDNHFGGKCRSGKNGARKRREEAKQRLRGGRNGPKWKVSECEPKMQMANFEFSNFRPRTLSRSGGRKKERETEREGEFAFITEIKQLAQQNSSNGVEEQRPRERKRTVSLVWQTCGHFRRKSA